MQIYKYKTCEDVLKMNDKIDVSEIMRELEEKLKNGLSQKQLDITDISKLIGEHIDKAKGKILKDTSDLIKEESEPCSNETCKDCGGRLKKTKN